MQALHVSVAISTISQKLRIPSAANHARGTGAQAQTGSAAVQGGRTNRVARPGICTDPLIHTICKDKTEPADARKRCKSCERTFTAQVLQTAGKLSVCTGKEQRSGWHQHIPFVLTYNLRPSLLSSLDLGC